MSQEHQRVAVAMIVGGDVDPVAWERCMRSLEPWVDGIFINWNGQGTPDDKDYYRPHVEFFRWKKFPWKDDFAWARNRSFELVPKDQYDWILWIDLDDSLENGRDLQLLLGSLDEHTQAVFMRYDYATDPASGRVIAEQWRERLLRTDGEWRWDYAIHEVCHHPTGTQMAKRDDVWIKHHRTEGPTDQNTRSRNRRILVKARAEHPEVPRYTYYLANEVYAEAAFRSESDLDPTGEVEAAIKLYREFIPQAPSPDDAYIACKQIAECHRLVGEFERALEGDLRAMTIHPHWPDAYLGIAQSYWGLGDWDKMLHFAKQAELIGADKPETTQVVEPLNQDYLPMVYQAIAHENRGDMESALETYQRALRVNYNPDLEARLDMLLQEMESPKNTKMSASDFRRKIRGVGYDSDKKSIAFLTRPLFEPWHPVLAKEGGIGGAETCVMEIAKRFAADDWHVEVFGTPGDHYGVDPDTGVEWWPIEEWITTEHFDVVVSSRAPEMFDGRVNCDLKLLWMHDVNLGDQNLSEWGDRFDKPDKIIALTDWHANHIQRLYGIPVQKVTRIPNGVDLARFSQASRYERQPRRFVYSSSPDRGVDVVLNMWAKIRERWADAELHIFYGWTAIDKIVERMGGNYTLERFKENVDAQLGFYEGEKSGIYWHDRVNQVELANELMISDIWLYPTYFMETYCITAVEMQAAGVIPVCSDLAALKETVPFPEFRVSGYPNNVSYQEQYLKRLVEIVDTPEQTKKKWRSRGMAFANTQTWDDSYMTWKTLVESMLPVRV